jgi:hypothetical protein
MSTPVNYYLRCKRGATINPFDVAAGTASVGSAADVELRIQINNGTAATGITREDVNLLIEKIRGYLNSGGALGIAGTDIPPL